MPGLDPQLIILSVVALVLGAVIGWLVNRMRSARALESLRSELDERVDEVKRQRDHVSTENESLKTSLQAQLAVVARHNQAAAATRTELDSLREKINALNKSIFSITAERDELKNKIAENQSAISVMQQRMADARAEHEKSEDFYKSQIETASEQRAVLERKIEDARSEHESLSNLLTAARSEHVAVNNMLAAANKRLESFDSLEQKVIELEADNAELRHKATLAKTEVETLQRDISELDAVKEQNRELVSCLESIENSRKQYESDAKRYQNQYEKAEKESETLRFKIGDIEKSWQEMQRASEEARKSRSKNSDTTPPFGLKAPQGEPDDLTEIVGVGKVFQELLHRLGVYHFRQIAAFGPGDVARINAELKEFKGRIEQDDWIGQARELHFKKFGNSGTH